ncbi:MAG: Maf family protein [Clostridia bacterium]
MALLENKKVILGSKSPRRRELLGMLGIAFEIISPECDETIDENLSINDAIIDVSQRKALCIHDGDVVITADTVVVLDDEILGKPTDEKHAFEMLSKLSGNTHEVLTAVSIKTVDDITSFCVKTRVVFNVITDEEISAYIQTGEPMDKAGAYGIQGLGGLFVSEIHGDYYSVVGLPIAEIYARLKNII